MDLYKEQSLEQHTRPLYFSFFFFKKLIISFIDSKKTRKLVIFKYPT